MNKIGNHPVLLMEDDPGVGSALKELLEMRLPVTVSWVKNLADAERVLSQQKFSAIITDGEFPKTAPLQEEKAVAHPLGVQLIRKIRNEYSPTVPILFQTARADYFAAATEAGATMCLQKPSSPLACIHFLEKELLQRHAQQR